MPAAAIIEAATGQRQRGAKANGALPATTLGLDTFTLDEVAVHNAPDDCWVIVRGNVYDVTKWVPNHPGGPLIYVKAGKDCTQLFDSYHPLSAR